MRALKSPLAILVVIAAAATAIAAVVTLGDEREQGVPTLARLAVVPPTDTGPAAGAGELLPAFDPDQHSYVTRCPQPKLEIALKVGKGEEATIAGQTARGPAHVSVPVKP